MMRAFVRLFYFINCKYYEIDIYNLFKKHKRNLIAISTLKVVDKNRIHIFNNSQDIAHLFTS